MGKKQNPQAIGLECQVIYPFWLYLIQQRETADIEPEKEFLGKPPVPGPSPAHWTAIPHVDIDGCPPCMKLSPPSFLGEPCCVVHLVLVGEQTACRGGKQLQAWARLPDKWAHGPIRPLRFKARFVNRLGGSVSLLC